MRHLDGVIDSDVDEELSIGDYVLTSGCAAAIVVVEGVARFLPEVLGDERSAEQDSFQESPDGRLFDCPQYTQPRVFEDRAVPEVLLGGNHAEIEAWRKTKALEKTRAIRPDLLH